MTKIRYIKDSNDQNFFPVTHERAVRDSNGKRLDEKLAEIEQSASDPNAVKYTEQELTDGPAHHPHHGHEHETEGEVPMEVPDTIEGITMNGSRVAVVNGIADLGTVISSHQSLEGYATESYVDGAIDEALGDIETLLAAL